MLEMLEARSWGDVLVVVLRMTALKNCVSEGYIQLPLPWGPVSDSEFAGVEGTAVAVSCARGIEETSRS